MRWRQPGCAGERRVHSLDSSPPPLLLAPLLSMAGVQFQKPRKKKERKLKKKALTAEELAALEEEAAARGAWERAQGCGWVSVAGCAASQAGRQTGLCTAPPLNDASTPACAPALQAAATWGRAQTARSARAPRRPPPRPQRQTSARGTRRRCPRRTMPAWRCARAPRRMMMRASRTRRTTCTSPSTSAHACACWLLLVAAARMPAILHSPHACCRAPNPLPATFPQGAPACAEERGGGSGAQRAGKPGARAHPAEGGGAAQRGGSGGGGARGRPRCAGEQTGLLLPAALLLA